MLTFQHSVLGPFRRGRVLWRKVFCWRRLQSSGSPCCHLRVPTRSRRCRCLEGLLWRWQAHPVVLRISMIRKPGSEKLEDGQHLHHELPTWLIKRCTSNSHSIDLVSIFSFDIRLPSVFTSSQAKSRDRLSDGSLISAHFELNEHHVSY